MKKYISLVLFAFIMQCAYGYSDINYGGGCCKKSKPTLCNKHWAKKDGQKRNWKHRKNWKNQGDNNAPAAAE